MAPSSRRVFRNRQPVWWTLVAGLVLTAALGWELNREAVTMDRQRLAMRVAEVQGQLDARLEKSEMLLQQLRDYLMLSGESRSPVFLRWCHENGLSINCRWILGIAVATNRSRGEWRTALPESPADWAETDWEKLAALAVERPVELDLALRSKVRDGQQFLADYGLRREFRDRSDRLATAVRESRLSMGERREVMRDAAGNPVIGTLFFSPVYRPKMAEFVDFLGSRRHDVVRARWMHLISVIVAPVDFKVLADSIWGGAPADLGIEIFASTNQTAETWLNISGDVPSAADPTFKAYLTHRLTWPMYGEKFSIFFHTTPLFEAQSPRRLAWLVVAAGTVVTLLVTALVGVTGRSRSRQERLTEQISEARDALAAAQEERNRFSRDLHDGAIQSLYAIQLGLSHTLEKLAKDPVTAGRELSAMRRDLDTVIAEIRQFITADDPGDESVDLRAVLNAMVKRAQAGTAARIQLECAPEAAERLPTNHAVHLANIARETLSNSLRHGKPQRVRIVLRPEPESVVLEISDDGAGFDPEAPSGPGVGLSSLRARNREMGGTLAIQSTPGQGTCVSVRVPAAPIEPAESEDSDDES